MTPVTLRVVRSRSPAPTFGWLLPGGAAGVWLEDIALLGVPAGELRLFVVPRSAGGATAGALLVLPPAAPQAGVGTSRALPLTRCGARCYVPADGRLWPPVEDAELDAAIPRGVHLLHPVFGSVDFEDADALRVSDLLVPSARREARWDAAHPGVRQPVLRGVQADAVPSADAVIAEGKGSTSTKSLGTLPPAPSEFPDPPDKTIRNWIARLLLRLTKASPRTASAPTWVNAVEDWASRQLSEDIERERAREIARLLHLLRTDPDLGLQFALPLTGFDTRGIAPPSGKLTARRTEFDERHLRGGRAADTWNLPPEQTRDLTTHYRQQAERAIRLGQHRRAAYILSTLLGDLRGAATALEQGGHWREAAALYRERLKDPAAAATCLERGGLLTEAIALHLEVGNRRRAAALLDRIGQRPEAERLWRELVAEQRVAGDRIGAASLLAEELRAPDEALEVLRDDWPHGGQADGRLRAALDLLGRIGRSDEACDWVRRTREARAVPISPIVGVLAAAAVSHPDAACRAEATDTVRVLVGSEIVAGRATDAALLGALAATDRGDRLLRRDVARFGARTKPTPKPARRQSAAQEIVAEFELPALLPESMTVVPARDQLFVCGAAASDAVIELHVLGWDGRPRAARLRWDVAGPRTHGPFLRIDEFSRRVLVAYRRNARRLFEKPLSLPGGRPWSVQTPAWMPDGLHGLCPGAALSTWTVTDLPEEPGLLVTCHGANGVPLKTTSIAGPYDTSALGIVCAADAVFVRAPGLLRVDVRGRVTALSSGHEVSPIVVAPRVLGGALLAHGSFGCALWPSPGETAPRRVTFAEDASSPKLCFLGDGRIAVIEEARLRLYRREGDRIRCVLDQTGLAGPSCIGVFPGPHECEIAVLTAPGSPGTSARLVRLRFPAP